MRAAQLPNLDGKISNGQQLRREVAKAVSQVEVYANRANIEPASLDALVAFFQAAIDRINLVNDFSKSLALTGTQTVTAGAPTSQLTATLTQLDAGTVDVTAAVAGTVYVSSDPTKATVSTGGLVTRVANGTTTITATNTTNGRVRTATRVITVTA